MRAFIVLLIVRLLRGAAGAAQNAKPKTCERRRVLFTDLKLELATTD